MAYYDDDGTKLDPSTIVKPKRCCTCKSDRDPDPEEKRVIQGLSPANTFGCSPCINQRHWLMMSWYCAVVRLNVSRSIICKLARMSFIASKCISNSQSCFLTRVPVDMPVSNRKTYFITRLGELSVLNSSY